jgi:hypothetical protein
VPSFAPRYPDRLYELIERLDDERLSLAEVVRRVGSAATEERLVRPSPPHVRRLLSEQRRRRADDRAVRQAALDSLHDLIAGDPRGLNVLERVDRARERVEERERRR